MSIIVLGPGARKNVDSALTAVPAIIIESTLYFFVKAVMIGTPKKMMSGFAESTSHSILSATSCEYERRTYCGIVSHWCAKSVRTGSSAKMKKRKRLSANGDAPVDALSPDP